MKVSGKELKQIIVRGIEAHKSHLTLTQGKVFYDFIDSLNLNKNYDLFCSISEMILQTDKALGPIVAELMKAVDKDLEMMDDYTFSNIGYFFADYMKKENAISYFKKEA